MTRRARISILALTIAALVVPIGSAAAAPAPAWTLSVTPYPANFVPGENAEYFVVATNIGGGSTTATPALIEVTLPSGLPLIKAAANNSDPHAIADPTCESASQTITCETTEPVGPGNFLVGRVIFEAPPAGPEELLQAEVSISGGGATQSVSISPDAPIQTDPIVFDFLNGLIAPVIAEDGSPATLAGSHPYEQSFDFGFPVLRTRSESGVALFANSGHPRDTFVELPRGLIANPSATPVLCTEAELTGQGECPAASQVGTLDLTTLVAGEGGSETLSSNIYNMVPPPGAPAAIAFNAANAGIFIHVIGNVRSDGDFGIEASVRDILAIGSNPVFNLHTQLWGDPSGAQHDGVRGKCGTPTGGGKTCPVEPQKTAFLTMPGECTGKPIVTEVLADSWEEPGDFRKATYESADLEGNAVSLSGCNQLDFKPTIEARPTTNVADSPSGLEFNLHQPQNTELGHTAPANLRDAIVTLPPGVAANPSQADGLGVCTEGQVGFEAQKAGIHFSKQPDSCSDAAKLGKVEVSSPLLAQRDDNHKLVVDPETGNPVPELIEGAVYLAEPFENPFDSLLAIYISVSDPDSGIVAKLAGKIEPDPQTGQLTARVLENPDLPLEDVHLEFFKGARASIVTPISCGTHTTTSTLVPWSAPEGLAAHPSDSFQTTAGPGGGACPSSEAAAQNRPAFSAGTLAPVAGAYSPFVLRLSRPDGSQRIGGLDVTLPPGLTGKLAGVAQCSDAQLAQAQSRSHPREGALEKQSPSCLASSKVGTVDVGAGTDPLPLHTEGTAYLAGPYKGAPLSVAIVTPAIAGPFDLGVVVVRSALYVNPVTAQIHAVSDPLPRILEGIPLDVRSVTLTMDRPDFTLNPTSCEPMSLTGNAVSTLGHSAALIFPFQVGGCTSLPFKPKLSLRLKGGTKRAAHPKLIATLKGKPGEANIARAQVKLPPSAFLDQAHIRTICTRVQFAADACPKGSIYGRATATTPLLDQPLSGNAYLRSSNHKLPDLVVALEGPESMPIEIELAGKTDSVKGSLRNTFEAVPDAPVSTFRLELFGGKRGLVINSRDLCKHTYRAQVELDGQNGKVYDSSPAVSSDCKGKGAGRKKHRHHGGRAH